MQIERSNGGLGEGQDDAEFSYVRFMCLSTDRHIHKCLDCNRNAPFHLTGEREELPSNQSLPFSTCCLVTLLYSTSNMAYYFSFLLRNE